MKYQRLLIIGLGHVGKWICGHISKKGKYDIQTLDVEQKEVRLPIDAMHICIPYSDSFVRSAADYCIRFHPDLVIVHSSVAPGTTRRIFEQTEIPIVHSPIRGSEENFWKWKKFIGGIKADAIEDAKMHLTDIGFDVEVLGSPETTELGKLFDTTLYALNVAWHQEMDRICKEHDISYDQAVTRFSETFILDPFFKCDRPLLWAGLIEKQCLIPNAVLLRQIYKSKMLDALLNSNKKRALEMEREGERERVKAQKAAVIEAHQRRYGATDRT